MSEYDEPWKFHESFTDRFGNKYTNLIATENDSFLKAHHRKRFMRCVNFLAGVSDAFLNTYLATPTNWNAVSLVLQWWKNPLETVPRMMLVDELQAINETSDSGKNYVSRKELVDFLEELGRVIGKAVDKEQIRMRMEDQLRHPRVRTESGKVDYGFHVLLPQSILLKLRSFLYHVRGQATSD